MATSLTPTLIDNDFRNWLKGALAVLFAREGLIDFVESEITAYQKDLLKDIPKLNRLPSGTTCSSCTTANLLVCHTQGFCSRGKKCNAHDQNISALKPNQPCPLGFCNSLKNALENEHRFRGPSWKNTDARAWCTDAYQIAKCYMPPDGYSDKVSLAETDFNGVIAVIINNKRFEKKMSTNFSYKANICEEARKAGREIRHSANHQLSDKELIVYIDVFIQLLSDPVYLATDAKAVDAVHKLKQLKTNTLTIHADDITRVLNDSIIATMDNQQNAILREIQKHFKVYKTDSIQAIDKKVQECVDQSLVKIKAIAEKETDEIISQTRQIKTDLKARIEKGKCELNLQTEEGKKELNEHIQEGNLELSANVEERKKELKALVVKGKNELNEQAEEGKEEVYTHAEKEKNELIAKVAEGKDELKAHIEKGKYELNAQTETGENIIKETAKRRREEIEVSGKQVLDEINRAADPNTGHDDDKLIQEFKEELVRFYNANESMIPASPLVEDHAVPLTRLYVQPPMSAFIKPNAFGHGKQPLEKKPISCYRELFIKKDNDLYKNIYIEANAGYGKTSFNQKVAMTWCLDTNSNKSILNKNQEEDVVTLKRFDLLFLLHLRDFQTEDECLLDDLILKFVLKNLPGKERFSRQFITRMLKYRTCLAIFD